MAGELAFIGLAIAGLVGMLGLIFQYRRQNKKLLLEIAFLKTEIDNPDQQEKLEKSQIKLQEALLSEERLATQLDLLEKQHEALKEELGKARDKKETLYQDREILSQKVIKLESILSEERKHTEERLVDLKERLIQQRQEYTKQQERLAVEFQNMAQNILNKNTQQLQEKNSEHLGHVLAPLKDQLGVFSKLVHESSEKAAIRNQDLKNELQNISQTALKMSTEAQALTRSLKSQSQVRGAWGEMILERSLESAGLKKGREYITQDSYIADDGSRVRPDAIVKLPGDRSVIIDSKLSLIDYNNYINAVSDEERQKYLLLHLNAVKTHIKQLSGKEYHVIDALRSPDFVIMFVPLESALMAALEQDPQLAEEALRNNIGIASPSTLMMVLRTIENLWRTERQIENAEEIAQRGALLYDKFRGFVDDLTNVRKHFDISQKTLDDSFAKLSEGRGNLISQAEKLRELGVKPKKELSLTSRE